METSLWYTEEMKLGKFQQENIKMGMREEGISQSPLEKINDIIEWSSHNKIITS